MKRNTSMLKTLLVVFTITSAMALSACGEKEPEVVSEEVVEAEENNADEVATEADDAEVAEADASTEAGAFTYEHDPRLNPTAMQDIVENPDAVYGFSPNPDSERLGAYADEDWTDPEKVETWRNERLAYFDSFAQMPELLRKLRDEGKSLEEMARAVSALRNQLRLDAYKDNPEGLEKCKASNLEKYGNEEGPTADSLYEKYGSWELVIQNAFSTNPGMDACLGLYDMEYPLYVELGIVEE